MDSERWEHVQSLFLAALDHAPATQEAFLDQACAEDVDLRREVEALLHAHETGHALVLEDRFLTEEPVEASDPEALLGQRIGPYRLKSLLGQGGMGEVYLAERDDDQYRQQVALKLVRPGFHTSDIVRRFRAERQILARLIHPHIARLLDGGMTEEGRPYLVMEHVEGVPITDYCDRHRCSIAERLGLFQKVCTAVQFAHRNLVVHRDLKPSNILVTEAGAVKLLDFGIAKLLDPEAVDVSIAQTLSQLRVMTPEYAAPEQVRGEAITTVADVYALGVLLYELLTGRRPYRLPGRMQAEIERIICEEAPTPPSTAVTKEQEIRHADGTTATLTPERVGAARRMQAGRLRRLLQGDLDNIVLMTLRKEPERRYTSAEQLSEDVSRYLAGRPVLAQRDTLRYRVGKFVRRNRVGVLVGVAFVAVLVGFSGVTAMQARTVAQERDTAQAERDKAEQVVQVLVNLFETSNPVTVPGGDTLRVGTFLERGEAKVLDDLQDQPETLARMKHVLSQVYKARSQFDRAHTLLEDALAQQRALKGPDDPDAATMFHDLANLKQITGETKTAEAMYRESLALQRRIHGEVHENVARSMQDLASVTEDPEEGRRLLLDALAMRRTLFPAVSEDIAANLNQLGVYHYGKGEFEDATRYWREALAIVSELFGEKHPYALTVMGNLAVAYVNLYRLDEAEAMHRRVLALKRAVYGPETTPVAGSLSSIGNVLARQGDHKGAEEAFRSAYALWIKIFGKDHWRTANDGRNIAFVLQYQGRYEEAMSYLQEAIAINTRVQGPESGSVGYMTGQRGLLLLEMGRVDEAARDVQEALRIIEENALQAGHYVADVQVWLGRIHLATGAPQEAEAPLREALAFQQNRLPAGHPQITAAQCLLGTALAMQERYAEAEPLLREGYRVYRTAGDANADILERARQALVATYTALRQPEKAAPYRTQQED